MKGYHKAWLHDRSRSCLHALLPRSPGRIVVSAAVVVAVLTLALCPVQSAWGAGRPTPSGESPPISGEDPTPAVTPSPEPVVEDCASWSTAAPADWALAMCDPFDDNRGGWNTGPYDGSLAFEEQTVSDGGYTWDLEAHEDVLSSLKLQLAPVTDFYAAVDTHKAAGPDGFTQYGLQFRRQDDDNYYMFLASDDRDFYLSKLDDGDHVTLIDWTGTDAFQANDWNRLAVKAEGPQFTFYINDQQVAQFTEVTIPQGGLWLTVAASPSDELPHAVIDLDNVEVRLPGAAAVTEKVAPSPSAPPSDTSARPSGPTEAAPDTPLPTDTPPAPSPTEEPPPPADTPAPAPDLPTATPPPTAAPVPPTPEGGWSGGLPTEVASDVTGWPVVFYDEFEDNANNWALGEDFGRIVEASKVIDVTFAWQFKAIQGFHSVVEAPYPAVSDFYVAVDVKRYSGVEDVQYGLTFRRQDPNNFYSFLVGDDGTYEAHVQTKDHWYPLIGRTKSKAIRPGESNRIAIKCEGPKITFFINGEQVAEVEDIRFRKGTIALTLSSEQADSGIVEFDNLEIRAPAE